MQLNIGTVPSLSDLFLQFGNTEMHNDWSRLSTYSFDRSKVPGEFSARHMIPLSNMLALYLRDQKVMECVPCPYKISHGSEPLTGPGSREITLWQDTLSESVLKDSVRTKSPVVS